MVTVTIREQMPRALSCCFILAANRSRDKKCKAKYLGLQTAFYRTHRLYDSNEVIILCNIFSVLPISHKVVNLIDRNIGHSARIVLIQHQKMFQYWPVRLSVCLAVCLFIRVWCGWVMLTRRTVSDCRLSHASMHSHIHYDKFRTILQKYSSGRLHVKTAQNASLLLLVIIAAM